MTRSRVITITLISWIGLSGLPTTAKATKGEVARAQIERLITAVAESGCTFIRNGKNHDSIDAADHLRTKLNNALSSFFGFGPPKEISVKNFIDKIAAQSSMTGKPYEIKCGDKQQPTKAWLWAKHAELQRPPTPPQKKTKN